MKTSEYSVVRTYSAGAWFGKVTRRQGKEATLQDAIRLWYWSGASSLSELAIKGVARPKSCKFPPAVPEVTLTEVIEVIPATQEAEASVKGVVPWTQH